MKRTLCHRFMVASSAVHLRGWWRHRHLLTAWPAVTSTDNWGYVVTDIEVDGPWPGANSMRSFASVAVTADGTEEGRFEAVLEPLPGTAPNPDTLAWFHHGQAGRGGLPGDAARRVVRQHRTHPPRDRRRRRLREPAGHPRRDDPTSHPLTPHCLGSSPWTRWTRANYAL